MQLTYTESIMSDTITANYVFVDSGASIDGKSVRDGLPLVGEERVDLAVIVWQISVIIYRPPSWSSGVSVLLSLRPGTSKCIISPAWSAKLPGITMSAWEEKN